MRRNEKQISELAAIEAVIAKADICHLALSVQNRPYVIPLCFGYQSKTLYFHSANEGRKLEMMQANPNVCFELYVDDRIVKADKACNWSMNYKSVIGFGIASIIEQDEEKAKALDIIMQHYANQSWDYKDKMLNKTTLFQVAITEMTGKQSLD